jgi:hypothetical protein
MIVEDQSSDDPFLSNTNSFAEIIPNHIDSRLTHTMSGYIQNNQNLHNCVAHAQLREDLKIHNWLIRGDEAE